MGPEHALARGEHSEFRSERDVPAFEPQTERRVSEHGFAAEEEPRSGENLEIRLPGSGEANAEIERHAPRWSGRQQQPSETDLRRNPGRNTSLDCESQFENGR